MAVVGVLLTVQLWLIGTPMAAATSIYDIPRLASGDATWVVDEGDVLSRLTEGNLTKALADLATDTQQEVRFVTIHRLDYGDTVESFADNLFETWFPTPDVQANQAVLVLDTVTNTAAIRAGEDVKTLLQDEIATSVAQETLMVPLRDGNKYNQALLDASDRLVAVLSGDPDPGAPEVMLAEQAAEGTFATREETEQKKGSSTIWVIGLLIAATVIPMATYYFYQGFSS
ncbi:photosystem II repair protein Psb32 [Leptolyngbya sp. AN02str]|uniref:photosystem II repair protein Psb32 n=1 Tax=Leptolyngbya sp. AN02str TaxID=3423363 RepID=UPI003D3186A8